MCIQEENIAVEEEMVENLMSEGFGDPLPDRHRRGGEVTVAIVRQNKVVEVPMGVLSSLLCPTTYYELRFVVV